MLQLSDRRKSPVIPLTIAAVALAALIATLVAAPGKDEAGDRIGSPSSSEAGASGESSDNGWEQLARREAGDPMAMGEVDAPVVMIAYSEFQCPFCGKFARDTAPTLIDKYVDAGTLRVEWRDFPYLGPESSTAARGGRAAAAQGSFWAFHDELYAEQLPPNSGRLDEDYLVGIANKLGLDIEKFRADLNSKATEQAITDDFAQGQAIGVTGTPAFVINGVPLIGAQPTQVFEETIEQAAAEAR